MQTTDSFNLASFQNWLATQKAVMFYENALSVTAQDMRKKGPVELGEDAELFENIIKYLPAEDLEIVSHLVSACIQLLQAELQRENAHHEAVRDIWERYHDDNDLNRAYNLKMREYDERRSHIRDKDNIAKTILLSAQFHGYPGIPFRPENPESEKQYFAWQIFDPDMIQPAPPPVIPDPQS